MKLQNIVGIDSWLLPTQFMFDANLETTYNELMMVAAAIAFTVWMYMYVSVFD